MKQLILVCGMLMAGCAATSLQAQTMETVAVSKSDYAAKVNQLNLLIGQNKMDLAKAKWDEVHTLIKTEFAYFKTKYKAAAEANNTAEKNSLAMWHNTQFTNYTEIMHLKEDMVANRAKMVAKLNDFGMNMLP